MRKFKIRKKSPVIVYPSSMIQQNHGETYNGHGYVVWDLNKTTYKHYNLQNDHGYVTIEVDSGEIISDINNLPNNSRVRVSHLNTSIQDLNKITTFIKSNTNVLEISYIRKENDLFDDIFDNTNFKVNDFSDVSYQNKILSDYLKDNDQSDDVIKNIITLNTEINSLISNESNGTDKNIRWIPKKFEFSNMFSYGEDNIVNFTNLKGIIGLFAKNTDGKSAIFDSMCYCMFDKFSRGYLANDVLNIHKKDFKCKFTFEIDGVNYVIEKIGKQDKKGAIKVSLEFWKEVDGNVINLNGEAKRNTQNIIKDYIGTYEDFVLTVLSLQNNKSGSFIELTQSERKDLICQFMGLTIYDKLHKVSHDKYKEFNSNLKFHDIDRLVENRKSIILDIKNIDDSVAEIREKLNKNKILRKNISDSILKLSEDLSHVHDNISDISKLESDMSKLKSNIQDVTELLDKSKHDLIELESKKRNAGVLEDYQLIKKNYDEYKSILSAISHKENEIDKLRFVVRQKMNKLDALKSHKYDPNCEYCINNVFVKDALNVKEELESDKTIANVLLKEKKELQSKLNSYVDADVKYNQYHELKQSYDKIESDISNIKNKIVVNEQRISMLYASKTDTERLIANYYKTEEVILENKKIRAELCVKKEELEKIDHDIEVNNTLLSQLNTNLGKNKSELERIEADISKVRELENKVELYKQYTSLVNRDGLPLKIINTTLPSIENEINSILHSIVDFKVRIESDGKNIFAYIEYNDNKKWSLAVSSGMEKFLSGLAIRIALITISNIPRPNIICIDEGWGSLDSNNLSSVSSLFDMLRDKFDFTWIISHLDTMRDIVDSQIEIAKTEGFSKVNHI